MPSDIISRKAVAWSLAPTYPQPAWNTFIIGPGAENPQLEGALADDSRRPVSPADTRPGGKYYSIVKLQIRYERQGSDDDRWAQGSGWLIKPDVLVTAGHCVFDHTYQLGKATEVKVYVGYNGQKWMNAPGVQFRHGARVFTTLGWHQSDVNRNDDVAFIKLDRPFDNISPFKWMPTPNSGKLVIGVVGYPDDKTYLDEKGAQMYEMYKEVPFDLNLSQLNMLEYTISTYGGQSGSPIIIKNQNTAIGTHVYGLGDKNLASVIRGTYGNDYQAFQNAISQPIPGHVPNQRASVVDFPATESAVTGSQSDFTEALTTALNVGSKLFQGSRSLAGPLSDVPSAAIASAAIAYTATRFVSSQTMESSVLEVTEWRSHAYNAIAGEAAFETLLKAPREAIDKYNVTARLREAHAADYPHFKAMAQTISPAILEYLASVAVTRGPTQPPALPTGVKPSGAESTFGRPPPLVDSLTEAARVRGENEGFMEFLRAVVTTPSESGLALLSTVSQFARATADTFPEPDINSGSNLQSVVETLCSRALMGNASLRILQSLPPQQLTQEGFLDTFVSTVKSIGYSVTKAMPGVIRSLEPIVQRVIQTHFEDDQRLNFTPPLLVA